MSDQEFRLTDESALDIFGMGYLTVFELDARMINLNAAIRVWRTWLAERDARIESAAEQRGAERAFRKTQEIIAGFDHTIDEARNRDDMINTGHLIQEIDTEALTIEYRADRIANKEDNDE